MKEKKDPYLSELDALDENEDLPADESTDVNLEEPAPESCESSGPEGPATDEMSEMARDLPVSVVVVIGRKEVALKDLADLKKGNIVELNQAPNDVVDLVAGGRVIAKGELVEIEGKLGVRVLKMLK